MTSPDTLNTSDIMDGTNDKTDPDCALMLEALEMHLQTIKSRLLLISDQFSSDQLNNAANYNNSNTNNNNNNTTIQLVVTSPTSIHRSRVITPNITSSPDHKALANADNSICKTLQHSTAAAEPKYSSLSSLNSAANASTIRRAKSHSLKTKPLSQIVEGWAQLHQYYKYIHQDMLENHIKNQMKKQREADLKWSSHCNARDQKALKIRLSLKPKMIRSELMNDNSFLKRIELSCFYKIVEAETAMRNKGLLKTASDVEEFWSSMLSPPSTHRDSLPPQKSPLTCKSTGNVNECVTDETATDSWALTGLREIEQIKEDTTDNKNNLSTDPSYELKKAIDANQMPIFHSMSDIIPSLNYKSSSEFESFAINKRSQLATSRDQLEKMVMRSRRNEFTSKLFIEMQSELRIHIMLDQFYENLNKEVTPYKSGHEHKANKKITGHSNTNKLIVLPPAKSNKASSYLNTSTNLFIDDETPQGCDLIHDMSDQQAIHRCIPLSLSDLYSSQSLTVVESHARSNMWRNTCL